MMIDDVCNIVYSHTDYSDIWPAYFGQTEKYMANFQRKVIFVDKKTDMVPNDYVQVIYDDKNTYVERLLQCFDQLKGFEYCIFSHEDMFLYDYPKMDKICKYINAVKQGKFDFVKLIKGGNCVSRVTEVDKTLFSLDNRSEWIFAVQPTIWRIDIIKELLSHHKDDNIWTLEVNAQQTCRKMGIKGAYSFGQGEQRGMHHWDNNVYPYVATAIVKGKWNMLEYRDILTFVLSNYYININNRGEFI